MNNMGWMYQNGLGVERDILAAIEMYTKAPEAGNSTAMVNLGNIYEDGLLNGEPDYNKCFTWYRAAAERE